ncbi:hypothetical protein SUGI_1061220 [Cryptomeria japonica]|nr:hypothetical protein SUGI_1061220 [Cryptomeria japonica]
MPPTIGFLVQYSMDDSFQEALTQELLSLLSFKAEFFSFHRKYSLHFSQSTTLKIRLDVELRKQAGKTLNIHMASFALDVFQAEQILKKDS